MWALAGALAVVLAGLLAPRAALGAALRGTDVYLFLAGMMVLAELARRERVFDWAAALAVRASGGSGLRLFALVYGVGVLVTVMLSNDATAVVLTPAVAAAVRAARAEPLPYLYACAFVANAASFVLPISNPANLVIFGAALPQLGTWLGMFALPSLLAVGATFAALALCSRRDLARSIAATIDVPVLGVTGRVALYGILATALALTIASARGAALGAVTAAAGAIVLAIVVGCDRSAFVAVARSVSWSVLLLVAGLFVLVAAIEPTGLLAIARHGVDSLAHRPPLEAALVLGTLAALVSNLTNNLPAGLIAGASIAHAGSSIAHAASGIAHAGSATTLAGSTAIGIDLGPNLSVTGSLATVLWLVALRREGIAVSAGAFLRTGVIVMPPALLLALGALALQAAR